MNDNKDIGVKRVKANIPDQLCYRKDFNTIIYLCFGVFYYSFHGYEDTVMCHCNMSFTRTSSETTELHVTYIINLIRKYTSFSSTRHQYLHIFGGVKYYRIRAFIYCRLTSLPLICLKNLEKLYFLYEMRSSI